MAEDTPSLLQLALSKSKRWGPECGVKKILKTSPRAAEIQELLDACRNREVRFATAAEVLKETGEPLSADQMSRHVRGKCSCS